MTDIIKKCEEFVTDHFENHIDSRYSYHSISHTKRTVKNAIMLSEAHALSATDREIVILSALLHDLGISESYEKHEDKSMEIAKKFLDENNYPAQDTARVLECINATKPDHKPETILEKIVHDANYIHLGKKSYFKRN